jgi:hypothetical protein
VSYKTREKKRHSRTKQRFVKKAQRGHPDRWYLTLVKKKTCCNNPDCAHVLNRGMECVYRHQPLEILCRPCAELRGIAPRPSALYDKKVLRPKEQKSSARSENQRERGRGERRPGSDAVLDAIRLFPDQS